MSRSNGMPMATRSTEGFYRAHVLQAGTANRPNARGSSSMPSSLQAPLPVQPQTMERASTNMNIGHRVAASGSGTDTAGTTTRPGALRPPNELGRQESEDETVAQSTVSSRNRPAGIHPRSAAVRRRSMAAIRGSLTHAAIAAAEGEAVAESKRKPSAASREPAMLCSLTYRGMEIVFATTQQPDWRIFGICARTRLVFQTLQFSEENSSADGHQLSILKITANTNSGLLAVALSNGAIRIYAPVPTDPKIHAFGRFRWVESATIQAAKVFYQRGEPTSFEKRPAAKPGQTLEMASSRDNKLLIAHRNQLAVFDVGTTPPMDAADRNAEQQPQPSSSLSPQQQQDVPVAQLLWTTTIPYPVFTAGLSGDGRAIAVVADVPTRNASAHPDNYGVQIFVRDREDGSQLEKNKKPVVKRTGHETPPSDSTALPKPRKSPEITSSVGILYKQGPFLEHSASVSKISFRGLGHNTASVLCDDEEGNDLLLTYSREDSRARIFYQNNWNQLVDWTTPSSTRVDWVKGAAAFSLGDLETQKKLVPKSTDSTPPSRNESSGSLNELDAAGGEKLLLGRQFSQPLIHNTSPSSAAGAWIVETTFRGACPALKLMRLSFLKRGSDTMHPTLFESVASILPAGSVESESVLNSGEQNLSVHGIWPAWNPWLSETSDAHSEETLSGSAMSFLGLSSGPLAATGGNFGDCILGGTHSPPSELRIVAPHSLNGNIVIMESPLWGNSDLGELELGSTLRYVLCLPEVASPQNTVQPPPKDSVLSASTEYDSNRLVAQLMPDATSISLTWRMQGTLSVLPLPERSSNIDDVELPEQYSDLSVVPVPLSLPTLRLPRSVVSTFDESVVSLMWWPDENFGGPPLLCICTSRGTILVFEVPPPWSALEPAMPNNDPFLEGAPSVQGADSGASFHELSATGTDDESYDDDAGTEQKEYDVLITPHPDFGLGLRLESQADGMPAVAGSFKKHPLNSGSLPAEQVGMIVLGDELLSVNGVPLDGISFDEIIATVRQVGSNSGPGKPLCMKFRRVPSRRRKNTGGMEDHESFSNDMQLDGSRRTMERIIGFSSGPQKRSAGGSESSSTRRSSHGHPGSRGTLGFIPVYRNNSDANSNATLLVGLHGELQQEFCRLVAAVRGVVAISGGRSKGVDHQTCMVLIPWTSGVGAPTPFELRGAALLFSAQGSIIHATRVEVATDCNPDMAKVYDLGSSNIAEDSGAENRILIESLTAVETGTGSRCLAVYDSCGSMRLVFATIEARDEPLGVSKANIGACPFVASLRHYRIFTFPQNAPDHCLVRVSSVSLLATLQRGNGPPPLITIWSSRPHPSGTSGAQNLGFMDDYVGTNLRIQSAADREAIVDVCFVKSGFLESSPVFVTLSPSQAVVYQRHPESLDWHPIRVLSYGPNIGSSTLLLSPMEALPHLMPAVRLLLAAFEEAHYLRADWHPDSLLSVVCTESCGVKDSLRQYARKHFLLLSKALQQEGNRHSPTDTANHPPFTPFRSVHSNRRLETSVCDGDFLSSGCSNAAASLFTASDEDSQLRELQARLAAGRPLTTSSAHRTVNPTECDIQDVNDHVNSPLLPAMFCSLTNDEVQLLWALGEVVLRPPDFQGVDQGGEFFLFASSLYRQIKQFPSISEQEGAALQAKTIHSFSVKKPTVMADDVERVPAVASAACLAAMMSSHQGKLLTSCRDSTEKVDWTFMREYHIPFWVRSDMVLAKLAEEVGQSIFKEKRDILECALFFIVARKHRTLQNLARTDRSDSGKKFVSFIADHDFASERGRRAAEKNAYSLLRKRRYGVAAAFFLLAEPPYLKSALETIATKLQDLNLAFLVARLMENAELASGGNSNVGGNGFGMGGISGAGYASFGSANTSSLESMVEPFKAWKPQLHSGARTLLCERGLASSKDDNCLTAIQLLWLNRREEASWWLSGLTRTSGRDFCITPSDAVADGVFDRWSDAKLGTSSGRPRFNKSSPRLRACTATNMLINFVSGPFLLREMNAGVRARFASALTVSDSLMRCGIEWSCIHSLVNHADPSDLEKESKPPEVEIRKSHPDSATEKKRTDRATHGEIQSSIFADFDCPPKIIAQTASKSISTGVMKSSIFDSFDAPPLPISQEASQGQGESSIFANIDAAGPGTNICQKEAATSALQGMNSSIFAEFDPGPPKRAQPATSEAMPTDSMVSSIFDAFAARPLQPSSGQMESSMFAGFDMAPPNIVGVNEHSTSGQESSESSQHPNDGISTNASKPDSPTGANGCSVVDDGLGPQRSPTKTPRVWLEWREQLLAVSAARRLLREVASFIADSHGEILDSPSLSDHCDSDALVPSYAAEVLQLPCEGEGILDSIRDLLSDICSKAHVDKEPVVAMAIGLLASPANHHRMFLAVLLHLVTKRGDLAEDLVRDASHFMMHRCDALALSNDEPLHHGDTIFRKSSLFWRKEAAHLSWQLELCLWLHRGGVLPLSGVATNEAIVAVRIGLIVASWNRSYECLESLIKCEPDCQMDHEAGRQLWTSLKMVCDGSAKDKAHGATSSGGWEFLVDCRRSEATDLLRHRPTGCFIIRPHPEDHGVFTLSFKTNLVPTEEGRTDGESGTAQSSSTEENEDAARKKPPRPQSSSRPVRKDDVVQHAILRLSDSGFRCGSFGPFGTLMKLLEAVSASLPFDLRFDQPPAERVIKDEGSQPSPNAVFFRKLVLRQAESLASHPPLAPLDEIGSLRKFQAHNEQVDKPPVSDRTTVELKSEDLRRKLLGRFMKLLVLSTIRKCLSSVASSQYEDQPLDTEMDGGVAEKDEVTSDAASISNGSDGDGFDEQYASASRTLRPFLSWCRSLELICESELGPRLSDILHAVLSPQVTLAESDTAIEAIEEAVGRGDSVLRRMIQPDSGVDFRTLRLADGGDSTVVVLFSKQEAVGWLMKFGSEKNKEGALAKLEEMERIRVVEPIDLSRLQLKAYSSQKGSKVEEEHEEGVRYRIVDPWEVESLDNREGETKSAAIGRERFLAFSLGRVAAACEPICRSLGGSAAWELWSSCKGGVALTKAIASVHPPWERGAGGDLRLVDGVSAEPTPFSNSIRQHLYRNALFRRVCLPQRFLALVQVELLDLKNLTAPGGSLALTVYALLRLRRSDSGAPLTSKTRTLDSASTHPIKLAKSSGPNAPASWGSVVRFRFPLPEDVACDGVSLDRDREILFKGPPCVLQVSVYERKLLIDNPLGDADVKIDGLAAGGQLEEWVPLRTGKHGIHWFARIRLTLRYELMCLAGDDVGDLAPSVGLRRIQHLSRMGGAQEDLKKSMSTPNLLDYFESFV